jgi:hypothetical protein
MKYLAAKPPVTQLRTQRSTRSAFLYLPTSKYRRGNAQHYGSPQDKFPFREYIVTRHLEVSSGKPSFAMYGKERPAVKFFSPGPDKNNRKKI